MNFKNTKTMGLLATTLALLLGACGPQATPQPTTDINAIYTQAAATMSVQLTQIALANPTATMAPTSTATATETPTEMASPLPVLDLGTATPTPTATVTQGIIFLPTASGPTPVPVKTATANGCYNASLIADVTIPAGTNFKPGDKFTKTWRVKNTGTCAWTGAFKIAFVNGDMFGADTTKLFQNVNVGGVVDISLDMVAPNSTGVVSSYWMLYSEDGKYFGPVLGATITLPGVTLSATPTKKPSGCNASLVSLSVQNGAKYNPGEAFSQTFTIKNTGTCEWNGNFKLVFVGGEMFGADTTKIRQQVGPGEVAEITFSMTAPSASGDYSSSWQLLDEDGNLFGPVITFTIKVK